MSVRKGTCAVVVTYNRQELLRRCLEKLLCQTLSVAHVVVIDNASTDGTASLVTRLFPEVDLVRLPRNTGSTGGFVRGMEYAYSLGYEWIWVMDDDVIPAPDCHEKLIDVAGCSGKRVVVPYRLTPEGRDHVAEAVIDEPRKVYDRVEPGPEPFTEIDLFSFEGPLVHRSVLDRVKLPEDGLFIAADDYLFATRIYKAFGPAAACVAWQARLHRQLEKPRGIMRSMTVKGWLARSSRFEIMEDQHQWKVAYSHRNRYLLLKELGWTRRRLQHALAHFGFIWVDTWYAYRLGWNWTWRLKINLTSWILGVLGIARPFYVPSAAGPPQVASHVDVERSDAGQGEGSGSS